MSLEGQDQLKQQMQKLQQQQSQSKFYQYTHHNEQNLQQNQKQCQQWQETQYVSEYPKQNNALAASQNYIKRSQQVTFTDSKGKIIKSNKQQGASRYKVQLSTKNTGHYQITLTLSDKKFNQKSDQNFFTLRKHLCQLGLVVPAWKSNNKTQEKQNILQWKKQLASLWLNKVNELVKRKSNSQKIYNQFLSSAPLPTQKSYFQFRLDGWKKKIKLQPQYLNDVYQQYSKWQKFIILYRKTKDNMTNQIKENNQYIHSIRQIKKQYQQNYWQMINQKELVKIELQIFWVISCLQGYSQAYKQKNDIMLTDKNKKQINQNLQYYIQKQLNHEKLKQKLRQFKQVINKIIINK